MPVIPDYFHYDVKFDRPIKKRERKIVNENLYKYFEAVSLELELKLKIDKDNDIVLGDEYGFQAYDVLHFYGELGKNKKLANSISNKFLAFAKTSMFGRSVKSCEFNLHLTKVVPARLVENLVNMQDFTNIIAEVKGDPKTLSAAFSIEKDNTRILVLFFAAKEEKNYIHLDLTTKSEEIEWDMVNRGSEELKNISDKILRAGGGLK